MIRLIICSLSGQNYYVFISIIVEQKFALELPCISLLQAYINVSITVIINTSKKVTQLVFIRL